MVMVHRAGLIVTDYMLTVMDEDTASGFLMDAMYLLPVMAHLIQNG